MTSIESIPDQLSQSQDQHQNQSESIPDQLCQKSSLITGSKSSLHNIILLQKVGFSLLWSLLADNGLSTSYISKTY